MGQRRPGAESSEIFWKNYHQILMSKNEKEYLLLEKANIPRSTMATARARGSFPNVVYIKSLAKALNIHMEEFFELPDEKNLTQKFVIRDDHGQEKWIDGELCLIPILSQKVAAGVGQAMIDNVEVIGQLPFLTRMLRGASPSGARSLEVRGDSMTGINIFDGDLVVFVPDIIRGDGIYVLQVGDELIVKRVEFDPVSRKIRIMSENPRYQDRVESADGQTIRVVGKVFGWVHAHPY
jgi:SOS-response transcriptional repressor LexA